MKVVLFCGGLRHAHREFNDGRMDALDGLSTVTAIMELCMDTFKEKQDLEDVFGRGSARLGRCGIINTK